jgi:hypothetical protein
MIGFLAATAQQGQQQRRSIDRPQQYMSVQPIQCAQDTGVSGVSESFPKACIVHQ